MSRRNDPSEKDFQRAVVQLAELHSWRWQHLPDSRRIQGNPGFPDLFLAKGGKLLLIELKVGYNTLETAQELWRNDIEPRVANATHEYHLWYPKDMEGPDGGEIARVLSA